MESYEKLVRDKIPEILDDKKLRYESWTATPEEFGNELIKKLGEEIAELNEALASENLGKRVEELADVIEVLDTLKKLPPEFSDREEVHNAEGIIESLKKLPEFANVEEVRQKKRDERGGFDKMIIVKGEK